VPENRTEVTAGGIARIAGVGRAAVSNWRRRHPDFPRPVGGTDVSPTFDLAAVEEWLRAQGKLTQVPLRERVWQLVEQDPAGAAQALRQVGALLLLLQATPSWRTRLTASRELADALHAVLRDRFGPGHPVPVPGPPHPELLRAAAELADELGPRVAYEFLLGRHLDDGPRRQYTVTPAGTAELMAELAGPARTVLDPACGFGGLLHAAAATTVHGQETDPEAAALTALRLALQGGAEVRIQVGDSLRADAFPGLRADAVLCHPPFNDRNWGHEELGYDARWEYGLPPRTESELAWAQHALARLREGGSAVLLMPPAAASRRSGRRIRAELLRRGALRAVVALPAGAAPPYGIPLHLWVLRRPDGDAPPQQLLLVDGGAAAGPETAAPWQAVRTAVLDAWRAFATHGAVPEHPGVCRAVPVIDLLDDDVDLSPARHLPPPGAAGGAELAGLREQVQAALRRTGELTPDAGHRGSPGRRPPAGVGVGELARTGALVMRFGGSGTAPPGAGPAVLTEHDVVTGGPPSGTLPEGPAEEPVLLRGGDVVVPLLGRNAVARVAGPAEEGAALGRNLALLRPDPEALDPWFLAGFLRGAANSRQASSFTTAATRLDVRRLQVPRLPLGEQRRYGERFRTLAAFEETLRLAGRLGEQLVQGIVDGLTDGSVEPY
jgi:hypothetical protein